MKTMQWEWMNKSSWGSGPWQKERCDKKQWADPETDYPCLIKRNPMGVWCGYVGIAPGHPAYEQGYDDLDVDVHGGLTYADRCQSGPEDQTICHVPDPGESEHLWWLGFDTNHGWDFAPGYAAEMRFLDVYERFFESGPFGVPKSYRTQAYVEAEVTRLARQLKDLEVAA